MTKFKPLFYPNHLSTKKTRINDKKNKNAVVFRLLLGIFLVVQLLLLRHWYFSWLVHPKQLPLKQFIENVVPRIETKRSILPNSSKKKNPGNRTKIYDPSTKVCLKETCLWEVASQLSRVYPIRNQKDSWCVPLVDRNDTFSRTSDGKWQGLILVKVPKAASSTSAGVVLRIANRTRCTVQYHHREGYFYGDHVPPKFLMGSVRNPGRRAFSTVWFFLLSPLNITPSDGNIIRAMNTRRGGKTKGKGGYQYNYLSLERVTPRSVWSPEHPTQVLNPEAVYSNIKRVIQTYDFLLVVERMEESLIALALLLDIPLSHVLVNSAKVTAQSDYKGSGGSAQQQEQHERYILSRFGPHRGQCYRPQTQAMSQGVQQYLQSPQWLAMNYADEILYRAAVSSLNRTIQFLGYDRFQAAQMAYQNLQSFAKRHCGSRLGSGCTSLGIPQLPQEDCYDRDFNCGYKCLDEAVKLYPLKSHPNQQFVISE